MMRFRGWSLPIVALALLLSACQPGAQPTAPASPGKEGGQTPATTAAKSHQGGTIVEISYAEATTLNPLLASDDASGSRAGLLYDSLYHADPATLDPTPGLAESWTVSDDKLSITVKLKDNVVWSDGQPITADDVKFTWDRMMDPKVEFPYRSSYDFFAGMDQVDARTVRFRLKEVFAPALDYTNLTPLPKHVFEKLDINDNPENDKPTVVSGPFQLKEWVRDDHSTFVPNDRFWEGKPQTDQYIFKVVKDYNAAYAGFKNGEADLMGTIQYNELADAAKIPNVSLYQYYYVAAPWDYMAFNLNSPLFTDVRVRRALNYAIDKKTIIDRVLGGHAKPQYSIYPSTSPVFTDNVQKYEFDVGKAKQLLAEAGWAPGPDGVLVKDGQPFKVRIFYNAGNKRREQIATIAQQAFKDVGVQLEVIPEEFGALLNRLQKTHDFDMYVLGWVGGREPHSGASIWSSDGSQNDIGYKNPEVDKLFKQGVQISYDMKDRKPVYEQIQKLVADDAPYIVLFTQETTDGANKAVKGLKPGPLGVVQSRWNIDEWYKE